MEIIDHRRELGVSHIRAWSPRSDKICNTRCWLGLAGIVWIFQNVPPKLTTKNKQNQTKTTKIQSAPPKETTKIK